MNSVKRLLSILMICSFVLIGCVTTPGTTPTTPVTIPAGCENSVLYMNAPWSFNTIETGILMFQIYMIKNPTMQNLIKTEIQTAIVVLNGASPTLDELSKLSNLELFMVGTMRVLYPTPNAVIPKCDGDLLVGYLKRLL